jgi:signal transduction histidine kinase
VDAASAAGASVQTIASEAGRVEELVNQWLFLSRPDPPQRSRVSLSQLFAESIAAARPAADHASVQLRTRGCPDNAAVTGDFRRLRQVMSNLLANAIHASAEGGSVTLEARAAEGGGHWEIRCRDEGGGFSVQTLARGTELFYSEKEGGLGIGLSVSAEIATAHGGRLTLANEGTGALVTVRLPAAGSHEA